MMVLFCGGHADGRWIDLPDGWKEYEVAAPGAFRWGPDSKTETEKQTYRIWDINILGWGMKVAALKNRHYEDWDVLRALTQRDVFKHLTTAERPTRAVQP
jgi:hypothetical protein